MMERGLLGTRLTISWMAVGFLYMYQAAEPPTAAIMAMMVAALLSLLIFKMFSMSYFAMFDQKY
jgi:O-antigen ligase